jgi:hypothetical protein
VPSVPRLLALVPALVLIALAAPATAAAANCDPIDPRNCLLPYPNDWFTKASKSTDTGRILALQRGDMPKNTDGVAIDPTDLNRNDGFSPGQPIITRVPGLDLAKSKAPLITDVSRSLAKSSPIVLINAKTRKQQLIFAELDAQATGNDVSLLIHPAKNLEDGQRYIVALRNLKNAQGKVLQPQSAFKSIRDGKATKGALAKRAKQLEPALQTLEKAGVKRSQLYLAWDFTVASTKSLAGRALAIRDDAFKQLGDTNLADLKVQGSAPKFTITDVQENPDSRLLRIVKGNVTVPCYLDQPGCPPGSKFNFKKGTDTPVQMPGNTMEAPFQCTIPVAAQAKPARLSLYGHGLLGNYTEVGAGNVRDMANEHDFVFCATFEAGMSNQDVGNAAGILQDFSKFNTLADRLQQGALNQLYLGRLMIHPQGLASNPNFAGLIDTSVLYSDGNSQGGIFGGMQAALAPDYTRAVLGVPGMRYALLLNRSVDFDTYLNVMKPKYPNELERQLIFTLVQGMWDRGEGNGYANHITRDPLPNTPPKKILMETALGDHQVAPIAAEIEARTIGAHVFQPAYGPGRTNIKKPFFGFQALRPNDTGSGIVVWDSGMAVPPLTNTPPRVGDDSHEDPRATPANREQKSRFLQQGGVIADVCGGKPCVAVHVK